MRALVFVLTIGLVACGSSSDSGTSGAAGAPNGGGGSAPSGAAGSSKGSGGNTTSTGSAGQTAAGDLPTIGGCSVFPAADPWNTDISGVAVDSAMTAKLQGLSTKPKIHPDFDTVDGIPYNVVPSTQASVPVTFDYDDESDPGPYPFPDPASALIEGGSTTSCDGDCHLLVVQEGACKLYEGWQCTHADSWHCGSGAVWDLTKVSYGQRPKDWTSADAAGLSVTAGLVRYDEAAAGVIRHALRFTVHCTTDVYVAPATHEAVPGKCTDPNAVPMGLRARLHADYDLSSAPPKAQAVLQAMKTYGLILADNGSDFYFQGDPNPGWDDDTLDALKAVPVTEFDALVVQLSAVL